MHRARLSDSDGDDDVLPGASLGTTYQAWADLPNLAFPEENIFAGYLQFADELAGSSDDDDAGLLSFDVEWPAPQSDTEQERDIYDGKLLGPPPGPRKHLLPILPACAKHTRQYWSNPLNLKHFLSCSLVGREVKDMVVLGLGDPLVRQAS